MLHVTRINIWIIKIRALVLTIMDFFLPGVRDPDIYSHNRTAGYSSVELRYKALGGILTSSSVTNVCLHKSLRRVWTSLLSDESHEQTVVSSWWFVCRLHFSPSLLMKVECFNCYCCSWHWWILTGILASRWGGGWKRGCPREDCLIKRRCWGLSLRTCTLLNFLVGELDPYQSVFYSISF